MQKSDLIQSVVNAGVSRKDATLAVDVLIKSIEDAYKRGERVDIKLFGSFIPKERKARQGRNVRTGETVNVPAKKILTFKASKSLEIIKD